jgi:hypothetical protein
MAWLDRGTRFGRGEAPVPGTVRRWRTVSLLAVAYLMTAVDMLIVNVALPTIGRKLHSPGAGPAVGGDRVRADLGRVLAARGPGRRLARPQPPVHGRAGDLHRGLAGLRAGHQRHVPDRHARHPGPGRRGGAARRAVDSDEHVQRGRRAQQGAGAVGAIGASGATVGVLAGGLLARCASWQYIICLNVPAGATIRVTRVLQQPGVPLVCSKC